MKNYKIYKLFSRIVSDALGITIFFSLGISKISNFKKSIIWKGVFPLIEICPNKLG